MAETKSCNILSQRHPRLIQSGTPGNAHDIEVLDTLWTTTDDYWASNSRRGLEEEEKKEVEEENVRDKATQEDLETSRGVRDVISDGVDDVAEPMPHTSGATEKRFSLKDLMVRVSCPIQCNIVMPSLN